MGQIRRQKKHPGLDVVKDLVLGVAKVESHVAGLEHLRQLCLVERFAINPHKNNILVILSCTVVWHDLVTSVGDRAKIQTNTHPWVVDDVTLTIMMVAGGNVEERSSWLQSIWFCITCTVKQGVRGSAPHGSTRWTLDTRHSRQVQRQEADLDGPDVIHGMQHELFELREPSRVLASDEFVDDRCGQAG